MRQRVALARAMINAPNLLLLDEPFAAVDHINKQALIIELKTLLRTHPITMMFVTHDIDEAIFLSDRIFILEETAEGASIQHSITLPDIPEDWINFYQSKTVTELKVHILQLLKLTMQDSN